MNCLTQTLCAPTHMGSQDFPPGPAMPWWGLPALKEMHGDYLGYNARLHREHGDICRSKIFNQEAWDLMSPEVVRQALVTNAKHLVRWERGIEVISEIFGQSVLVSEGETWQRQRRMLLPAFSPKNVNGYAELMTSAAQEAFDEVLPTGQDQALVTMDHLWNGAAMDVILRTMFSQSAKSESIAVAKATQVLSETVYQEVFQPTTLPDWLPLPGKVAKRKALHTLRSLIQRHIDARMEPEMEIDDNPDLLGRLLALRDVETGEGLSPQEIFDQCMVSFQAGHETSATALLWWSRLMAEHPEAAKRAREEVMSVVGSGKPGPEHVGQLPWLTATLKESMRLYPPVAAIISRITTAPIEVGGWTIPKGAMLRVSPYVLHRDRRSFSNPEAFQPERFLEGAELIPRGAYLPFGVGPRVCLGQHFAMLEMALLSAMLLQRFELELPHNAPAAEPQMNVTLRPKHAVELVLRRIPDTPSERAQ